MDLHGIVMAVLILLPAWVLGYIAGMLNMRRNYLGMLRRERTDKNRIIRYAAGREQQARYIGYAVGYREGSRQ